ncbi:stage V sporulation protein E [Clostridia bacterium]|nr:stage V sporulation protein E [Clostridia bacterium]
MRSKLTEPKNIRVFQGDPLVLVSVMVLVFIGILMIFSSSYYSAASKESQGMFFFLGKQAVAATIGFVAMLVLSRVPYFKLYNMPICVIAYLLGCGLVIYAGLFGDAVYGASRWISLPGPLSAFSFQPSEAMKIACILFCSAYLANNPDRAKKPLGMLIYFALLGLPAFLIWRLTNNFSSALTIVVIGFAIIFVASPYWKQLIAAGVAGAGAVVAYLFLGGGFREGRMLAWLDPWASPTDDGFQVIQSLYAVASGGLFGLGAGNSRQKMKYMPEAQNDFIFAIICEELGFLGAFLVITLFALFIWRGVSIAVNAVDEKGAYMATGVTAMIAAQVIINIAVVTNTVPVTGIPMPFISYGGTSVIFAMAAVGILLNVSSYSRRAKRA